MRFSSIQTAEPNRLLVRGVNWLGDAVMSTPALVRLREALPRTHITLLTHEKLSDLWRHHSAVDEVMTFRPGESPWSVSRRLRAQSFDTALLLPNSPRSGLEAWLAAIPQRIGVAWPWRNWFLTQVMPAAPGTVRMHKRSAAEVRARLATAAVEPPYAAAAHQLHHYLHLVSALGASPEPLAPCLMLTEEERQQESDRLWTRASPQVAPKGLCLGLVPGAEYGSAKRWPAARFAQVAKGVSQQTGCQWMIFGGPKEVPLAETIRAEVPGVASLCGRTTLRELMIGLTHCRLLLTNDTGPMHLAAALDTPVVALFGSTSPELTGPGRPGDARHTLLRKPVSCSPCFRRSCPVDFRCMTSISIDEVVEAVLRTARQNVR